MGIEVNTLHPLFAAELSGVDCARPDAALAGLVEGLMREHAVLCIRGQSHIDDERHLAFARAFGPLELPGTTAGAWRSASTTCRTSVPMARSSIRIRRARASPRATSCSTPTARSTTCRA